MVTMMRDNMLLRMMNSLQVTFASLSTSLSLLFCQQSSPNIPASAHFHMLNSLRHISALYEVWSNSTVSVVTVSELKNAGCFLLSQILGHCSACKLSYNVLAYFPSLQKFLERKCGECGRLNTPESFKHGPGIVDKYLSKHTHLSHNANNILQISTLATIFFSAIKSHKKGHKISRVGGNSSCSFNFIDET